MKKFFEILETTDNIFTQGSYQLDTEGTWGVKFTFCDQPFEIRGRETEDGFAVEGPYHEYLIECHWDLLFFIACELAQRIDSKK